MQMEKQRAEGMGQRCQISETGERRPEHGRMPLQGITPEGLNIIAQGSAL
jgi:hypothetical protein